MQARSRVSLADEATVDTGRLIGCNEHANVARRGEAIPGSANVPYSESQTDRTCRP